MKKILIIEDEKIINDYIKLCLEKEDLSITQCYSGQEAIDLIEEEFFHIIITDLIMENKSGFDVLSFVKKNNYQIPIIVLSALSDEDSLIKAYDYGAIDYLNKPINEKILLNKVDNLLHFIYMNDSKLTFNNNNCSLIIDTKEIHFSKIEYSIIELMYKNSPRVYTKYNLIDIVWSGNYNMADKIVEVNIFNIRKKLGQYSYLIKTRRGIGYYFEDKN